MKTTTRTMKAMILIASALILITGCKKKGPVQEELIQTVFAVDTVKVVRGDINEYIKLTGEIKSKREVKVYPDQNGKIALINVSTGNEVRKGQTILEIDPSRPGMIYSNNPVNAPISGSITSLPFKIGETVNVQTPIATIGNLDDLEIIANVSEKYISKMKINLDVIITVDAYPDGDFMGKITEISPVVDPMSRMMEIRITINKDSNLSLLKPGMYASLKIITEKKNNTYKIPTQCIVSRYGDSFVFVIKDLPGEMENLLMEKKLLSGATDDERQFIESLFPKSLPLELRVDIFEYRILKSLKDQKEIDILKRLYEFDKEKETYQLVNNPAKEDLDIAWNIFIKQNYKFQIKGSSEIHELSQSDVERFRTLLIKAKIIDEQTKYTEKRIIRQGIEIDNKSEITSGVKPDDEIVFYGQSLLEDNSYVRIMQVVNVLSSRDEISK